MADLFQTFLLKVKTSRQDIRPLPKTMMAIDPGQTSGWAVFNEGRLIYRGDIRWSKPNTWDDIITHLLGINPDTVVCEDYKIYSGKRLVQAYSSVETIRIIGAIEYTCRKNNIKIVLQMASGVKGFVTDKKLKEWGYWAKNDHIRDAIRHGCYYLMFGKE